VKAWSFGPLVWAIATISIAADIPTRQTPVEEGQQLFLKQFAVDTKQPNGGDGLGPLFNHVSCAACHRQGALGGGGDVEFNVSLLCAQLEPGSVRPEQKLLLFTLRGLHPAFVGDDNRIVPAILLHRFGPGERYFQLKTTLGGQHVPLEPDPLERKDLQQQLAEDPLPFVKKSNHIRLIRAQRNTTALFGAGLIDRIPDEMLHDLAKSQAAEGKVSGRVPPIGPNKVGRFGWRGQQERLHDFVLGACANELGLEVPGNSQPINPLQPKYRTTGLDLTAQQCESLTAFVASLPPPVAFEPQQPFQRAVQSRGREVFDSVGCAHCHVERVGSVESIYSDLLLHDMGPALADPVLAEASLTFIRPLPPLPRGTRPQPPPPTASMYYGGSTFQDLALTGRPPATVDIQDPRTGARSQYRVESSNLESEWRTPPLWGVADSPPYLHDGRAATLIDAISLHGGEAAFAVEKFNSLELPDRNRLISFLRSLRAP